MRWLMILGLVFGLNVPSLAYDNYEEELADSALRIPDECGCEGGELYLYSVSFNGTVSKRLLRAYGTKDACELGIRDYAECR